MVFIPWFSLVFLSFPSSFSFCLPSIFSPGTRNSSVLRSESLSVCDFLVNMSQKTMVDTIKLHPNDKKKKKEPKLIIGDINVYVYMYIESRKDTGDDHFYNA